MTELPPVERLTAYDIAVLRALEDPLSSPRASRVTPDDERDLRSAIDDVLATGRFVGGPWSTRLEAAFERRFPGRAAVTTASGSDALQLALLSVGVGPGDEVIVPALTFIATAGAAVRCGATPVVVDIRASDLTMDPVGVERAFTQRTRVVLPVHLYGQPAPIGELAQIAAASRAVIVEDAAQSIGATIGARPVGGLGEAAGFSFYPSKVLGGVGNGGLALVDERCGEPLRRLRRHGLGSEEVSIGEPGLNARMGEIEAAFLLRKLVRLTELCKRRRANASRYDAGFETVDGVELITRARGAVPSVYCIRITGGRRDAVRAALDALGIETAVHYSIPLHRQPVLGEPRFDCPVADAVTSSIISLPFDDATTPEEQERVITAVGAALARLRWR